MFTKSVCAFCGVEIGKALHGHQACRFCSGDPSRSEATPPSSEEKRKRHARYIKEMDRAYEKICATFGFKYRPPTGEKK